MSWFLGLTLLDRYFVPHSLFPLLIFGVCGGCVLPVFLAYVLGVFIGNACWFWRLGELWEEGESLGEDGLWEAQTSAVRKKLQLLICFRTQDETERLGPREQREKRISVGSLPLILAYVACVLAGSTCCRSGLGYTMSTGRNLRWK